MGCEVCNKKPEDLENYFEIESNRCEKGQNGACWWSRLFIIDYVLIVVLFVMSLVLNLLIRPYRMFSPTVNITTALVDSEGEVHNVNQTIDINQERMYPAVKESLNKVLVGVVLVATGIFCWGVAQLFIRFLVARKWNVLHDLHNAIIGALESVVLELLIASFLKPFAGRYRPRYNDLVAHITKPYQENEGRVSYPSGHAGTAFACLFFFTLYLLGKTRVYSSKSRYGGGAAGRYGCVVLCCVPTIVAFLIAITRTRDYMHHFSDINAGAIIGIIAGTLCYFTMYPSLTDPECQLPRIRLSKKPGNVPSPVPGKGEGEGAEMSEVIVNTDDDDKRE